MSNHANKQTDKPDQSHLLLFGGGNNSHEGIDSHQYLSRLHSVWISIAFHPHRIHLQWAQLLFK